VRGEFAENAIRKDFLPSEIEAIRRAMLPAETVAAKGRMVSAHASHGKFPEQAKSTTRDKIGASAGVSGRTVENHAARGSPATRQAKPCPSIDTRTDERARSIQPVDIS
jgi:hypothetical protein